MSDQASAPAVSGAHAPAESNEAGNTVENAGDEGNQEAAEPKAPPKKKAPSYRKIKVGDQELALSDEDIARDYSKWKSADQKFREAAETRKATEAFMKALEEDPESVLSDKRLPLNRKKLAEKWLMEQLEAELNPPDPRDAKLSEAEKKLKAYEEREKQEHETREKREYETQKEQRKTAIADTLRKAMDMSPLSKNPESAAATLREMALHMRVAKEHGEDVTPEELVAHIQHSRLKQFYTLANDLDGDELIEFLGETVVKKLRGADLARLKASREPKQTHRNEEWASSNEGRKPSKKMDAWAMKEHARKLLK